MRKVDPGEGEPAGNRGDSRAPGAITILSLVLGAWLLALAFVVLFFPYYNADELSYGEWSMLIASTGRFFFPSMTLLIYQRPLLYVTQGWLWRLTGHSEIEGRTVVALFGVLLLLAMFRLARRFGNRELGMIAILVLLNVPDVARTAGLLLTEIPVAALLALAGVLSFGASPDLSRRLLLAIVTASAVLAKPSAWPAIAGLFAASAIAVQPSIRSRLRNGWIPMAAGIAVAALYDVWLARQLTIPVRTVLVAGPLDYPYYAKLASELRWSGVLGMGWLGGTLRVPLIVALIAGAAGAVAGSPARSLRRALALVAAVFALAIAARANLAEFGEGLSPLATLSIAVSAFWLGWFWFALAAGMRVSTPAALVLRQMIVWALPSVLAWAVAAPYDIRLLSPAWPPLAILVALLVQESTFALPRCGRDRAATLAMLVLGAGAVLTLTNFGGLSFQRWSDLLADARRSGDPAGASRREVFGALDRLLAAVRREAGPTDRLLTPDGQFRYFFPGRTVQAFPGSCSELAQADIFLLPTYGVAKKYFREQLGVSPEPEDWARCERPRLEKLGSVDGTHLFRVVREEAVPARGP